MRSFSNFYSIKVLHMSILPVNDARCLAFQTSLGQEKTNFSAEKSSISNSEAQMVCNLE